MHHTFLDNFPKSELDKWRSSSSFMSPLLIRLKNNSITNESFTHLHDYLTTRAGWKRSPDQEEGQKPYTKYHVTKSYQPDDKNVICSITLIIYDYCLVVCVQPMDKSQEHYIINSSNYCFAIKEEIIKGLSEYQEINEMEFLYFCSSHESSKNCPYYAHIEDGYLKCNRTDHIFEPQDKHIIWFKYNFFCNGMSNSATYHFAWDFYYLNRLNHPQDAGEGIAIAIIDTGIDPNHPAIRGKKIILIKNQTLEGITNTDCDHGTAVAGVAVGRHLRRSDCALLSPNRINLPSDKQLPIGVAPKASLVVFKVAKSTKGPYDNAGIISALKTIKQYNTTADANRQVRVRIIVMPFKLKKKDTEIEEQIKSLHIDQEVLFIVSAGNHGFSKGLGYPATSEHVLTIGSSTRDSFISPFSSRPISKSQYKDILYVLGEYVLVPATKKGQDWDGWPYHNYDEDEGKNDCFLKVNSGTSYSAPAMAGLIAILMQHQVEPDKKTSDTVVASWTAFFKEFEEKNLDEKHKQDPGVIIPKNFQKNVMKKINTSNSP